MKDLFEKISSYNLFNYLLPGILFAVFAEQITHYKFIQSDVLVGLFLYYFIGLIVSRIGSLIIGPMLRTIKFIKFAPYGDFVRASKMDPKIEILSEQNNMFRALIAMFVALAVLKLFELIADWKDLSNATSMYILLALLFIMFVFSYRKQTAFIKQRVGFATDDVGKS